MSRIGRAIMWFRDVSVLAEDEQRRSGHPEIDLEHLFLALVSVGGPVTDMLARHGVTLASAREAFERTHEKGLGRLGIALPPDGTSRTIPPGSARGGFTYREGVRKLLEDAARQPAPDVALLRVLLGEPSGHIHDALREMDVDPGSLGVPSENSARPSSRGEHALEYRRFVSAPPEAVWALISDPDRWLEWNDFEFEHAEVLDRGVVRAHARTRDLNGRPTRVTPRFAVSECVVSRHEAPTLIQWERSFPNTAVPANQSLRISLVPTEAGTEITVSFLHIGRPKGHGGIRYWLLRPVAKFMQPLMVRAHLRGKADNISRALRS